MNETGQGNSMEGMDRSLKDINELLNQFEAWRTGVEDALKTLQEPPTKDKGWNWFTRIGTIVAIVVGLFTLFNTLQNMRARRLEEPRTVKRILDDAWDVLSGVAGAPHVRHEAEVDHARLNVVSRKIDDALSYDPENPRAKTIKGITLLRGGNIPQAIQLFREAIDSALERGNKEQAAKAANGLGSAFDAQSDYVHAIEAFDEAIKLNPTDGHPRFNKGNTLRKQGKLGESLTAFREASHYPDVASESYCNIGELYLEQDKMRDLEAAERAFRQAIELNPKLFDPYLGLASTLAARGDIEGCVTILPVIRDLPDGERVAKDAAGLCLENQDPAQALKELGL